MAKKVILVTGATGKQGRALIHALKLGDTESNVEPEFHVLALTRTVSSPAANEVAAHNTQHVTVVQGTLDSADDIRKIFEDAKRERGGVWGVFCVLAFPGLGANADGEEKQGKTLADIAAEYGVSSYIFSSVERGGEYNDDNAQLDRRAKVMIERHIRVLGESKGLPWTILRPGFFMENYENTIGSIAVGVLKKGLKPTTTNQLVAAEDIGHVAEAVFQSPQNYASQIMVIAGESSTMAQQEESYKRATGKHLPSIPGFLAWPLLALNSHTKALIADIERVHDAGVSGKCPEVVEQTALAKRAYPEMQTFEMWARRRVGKAPDQGKDWNQVSIGRLATGTL
ncbi:NmrA-like family domain-containing protein 1 [Mycena venus]|uniref:NmrA-like family domain-containing protein 1 n=1 Tax=Mycena venus TaxID=2733690 RepID=A0A8H6XSP5_9AGAR|nr:NmrA-like family domain-containing protein 1 [Mycena venus]